MLQIVLAILLRPVAVAVARGLGPSLLRDILLTILGWSGAIHALPSPE